MLLVQRATIFEVRWLCIGHTWQRRCLNFWRVGSTKLIFEKFSCRQATDEFPACVTCQGQLRMCTTNKRKTRTRHRSRPQSSRKKKVIKQKTENCYLEVIKCNWNIDHEPVAWSMGSTNQWFRCFETYAFLWYLTMVSALTIPRKTRARKPIRKTWSVKLPHIPVTAFSQTDLFLVWISREN